MKNIETIHLDLVGGIAGDMFLSACLHAFPEEIDGLLTFLDQAGLPQIYTPAFGPVVKDGIDALYLAPVPDPDRSVPSGHWSAIRDRISGLPVSEQIKVHAIGIYQLVAEAEAKVHGIPVERVHFHELADWDTYMDVLGAAYLIDRLSPTRWTYNVLPLGGGFVHCDHGRMPVPAPATALLMAGMRCVDDGVHGERVTPTGAAIVKYLDGLGQGQRGVETVLCSGFGAGTMSLDGIPNVLRITAFAGAEDSPRDWQSEQVLVLSFEIDDMTGEEIATAVDHLRRVSGVLDVSTGLRLGKKGRAMSDFRILARPDAEDVVARACFLQTTTLGLRLEHPTRLFLDRDHDTGETATKRAFRPDGSETRKVEQDEVRGHKTLAARRRAARRAETR